jgi:hypothetical protein
MLQDDIRGRMLAQTFWGEIEKISNAQNKDSMESSEENKTLNKTEKDDEREVTQEKLEDIDEKDHIIGTNYIKRLKEKHKVRGVPVFRRLPGYKFSEKSQSYVPDTGEELRDRQQMGYLKGKAEGMSSNMDSQLSNKEQELEKLRTLVNGGSLEKESPANTNQSENTQTMQQT